MPRAVLVELWRGRPLVGVPLAGRAAGLGLVLQLEGWLQWWLELQFVLGGWLVLIGRLQGLVRLCRLCRRFPCQQGVWLLMTADRRVRHWGLMSTSHEAMSLTFCWNLKFASNFHCRSETSFPEFLDFWSELMPLQA